jgi:hypothetical protein
MSPFDSSPQLGNYLNALAPFPEAHGAKGRTLPDNARHVRVIFIEKLKMAAAIASLRHWLKQMYRLS